MTLMTASAISAGAVDLSVGGVWNLSVCVTDIDGDVVDDAPIITVTLPAGGTSTPTVETVTTGVYRAEYVVASAGRYIARAVTSTHGSVDFAAFVTATTAGTAMPSIEDLSAYLFEHSATDEQLQDVLDAESAAQRAVCRIGASYPADLRQALLRRCARNLALRKLPLAVLRGDADAGSSDLTLPGRDPEVRRLEAPYRKLVIG